MFEDPMMGLFGLSVAGDVGGAISQLFQQQRLRDLYKKQIEQRNAAMNPAAIAGAANTYAQNIYNTTSPQIARQAAGALGAGGVADGGYANSLMQQSLANYMGQLQQQGAQSYLSGLGTGVNALNSAQGAVGPSFGSSGASMDALKYMMLMQAYGGRGGAGNANQNAPFAGMPMGKGFGAASDQDSLFMPGIPASNFTSTSSSSLPDSFNLTGGYPLNTFD